MKWLKLRDGVAATGADGTVYRLRRDPLRIEAVTPDGEVVTPDETVPWESEGAAKWWCSEREAMRTP